jgi:hypothetical protein
MKKQCRSQLVGDSPRRRERVRALSCDGYGPSTADAVAIFRTVPVAATATRFARLNLFGGKMCRLWRGSFGFSPQPA